MDDAKRPGMQRLALKMREGALLRPVYAIPQKRMAQACHVHADLVSPPGFQLASDIGIVAKALQHLIMGNRLSSIPAVDTHLLALRGMPADRGIYGPILLLDIPVDDGDLDTPDGVFFQLPGKTLMRHVIFAGHQ
mgnify:CR=1 FL=1